MCVWQVVLSVAWCCSGQLLFPNPLRYYGAQEYRMEAPGQKSFAFYGLNQNRQETRLWDGTVVGQYSYIDADGKPAVTYYDAGPLGFRVRANNLPIAPAAPAAPAAAPALEAPKPVTYTAEVAQARKDFMDKWTEAAAAATTPVSRKKRQISYMGYPSMQSFLPATMSPMFYSNTFPSTFPIIPSNIPLYTTIKTEITDEAKAKAVETSRKRRDVEAVKAIQVPLPLTYTQAVPAVAKTTVKTHQLEAVKAAVPADTTRLELITKEREYAFPTVRYVQPSVQMQPIATANPIMYSAGGLTPFLPLQSQAFLSNPWMPIMPLEAKKE